jgi:rhodanese-related sulfurtransferase
MKKTMFIVLCAAVTHAFSSYDTLSADTLSKWITTGPPFSFILIDVRDSSELDTVIGTSLCRPYTMSLNRGVFTASYSLVPKAGNVIVYCMSGHRAATAAAMLYNAGYPNVYGMATGFSTWKGPKQLRAAIRPLSDLPTNSMTAGPAGITTNKKHNVGDVGCYAKKSHFIAGNRVIVARTSSITGDVKYYNPSGQVQRVFRHRQP